MLLQAIDATELMRQAGTVRPDDYSGYIFAVSVITFFLVLAVTAGVHLYLKNNTLQKEQLIEVRETAKQNTELLMSIEAFFEKISTDLGHIPPQITQASKDCSARSKEHMNKIGKQIQKNEPINGDIVYTS